MKNEIAERTVAQEIARKEAAVAARCLKAVKVAGLASVTSNAGKVIVDYLAETENLSSNAEGRKLAREVTREEAKLIMKILASVTGTKLKAVCDGFAGVLRGYLAEEE